MKAMDIITHVYSVKYVGANQGRRIAVVLVNKHNAEGEPINSSWANSSPPHSLDSLFYSEDLARSATDRPLKISSYFYRTPVGRLGRPYNLPMDLAATIDFCEYVL